MTSDKELKAKRDELAKEALEYLETFNSHSFGIDIYKKGFDAGIKLMKEREAGLVDAAELLQFRVQLKLNNGSINSVEIQSIVWALETSLRAAKGSGK